MTRTSGAEDFCFIGCDGQMIAGTQWHTEGDPRAVVQIAHGMGEHIGRYADAAAFLADRGIAVLGNDHRGHGRSGIGSGALGRFGEVGFDGLVADMSRLIEICRAEYPGLPVILLGHSMGSFAAQQLVLTQSEMIAGLILSGTGALDSLLDKLTQLNFDAASLTNKSFEPVRTSHDWLSRDPSAVDAFLADPLCFAAIERDSALSVARAAPVLSDMEAIRAIRADLPVYCLAGSLDPIGQESAGVQLLLGRYAAAGLHAVECDIYQGGRHEMLHETNREEVLANLLGWIERTLASADTE